MGVSLPLSLFFDGLAQKGDDELKDSPHVLLTHFPRFSSHIILFIRGPYKQKPANLEIVVLH